MRFYGKYRGTVVSNVDPLSIARLQATVPDVQGSSPTTWAMPSLPYAGPQSGLLAIPPVGAGVWIEFEQGDPDYPIWSGCWWGSAAELPAIVQAAPAGAGRVILVTPGRHELVLSDLPGPDGGILLLTPGGARIAITGAGIVLDNGHGASITLSGNTVHITGVQV